MENHCQVSADTTSSAAAPQSVRTRWRSVSQLRPLALAVVILAPAAAIWFRQWARSVGRALIDDWRTHKYVLFALLVLAITTMVVVAYYLNHPQPHTVGDTGSYLRVAQQI